MRLSVAGALLSAWLLLATAFGCTSQPQEVARAEPLPTPTKVRKRVVAGATRNPFRSSGPRRVPIPAPPRAPAETAVTVGMSWYAEGVGTESGEAFDPNRATCATATAHALRRFVTLRNPVSRRTSRAWLNDTGSFGSMVPARTYDCTPAVWAALGFNRSAGVVQVEVVAA